MVNLLLNVRFDIFCTVNVMSVYSKCDVLCTVNMMWCQCKRMTMYS